MEHWADGSSYKGEYKKGAKEGEGVFMWRDGSVYRGQFKDNNIQGFGVYTWADNKQYTGTSTLTSCLYTFYIRFRSFRRFYFISSAV